jgi:outer membrane protein assembly factor BamB
MLPACLFLVLLGGLTLTLASAEDTLATHLLWHSPLEPAGCMPYGSPAAAGHKLFVVCSGIQAYAQDSGQPLWRSGSVEYDPHRIVTAADRVFVVEATVSALDEETGGKKWEFHPDDNASLGRALVIGDRLFFGTASHRIYCVQVSDGKMVWKTDVAQAWEYPAVVRGLASDGNVLYATVEQWRSVNGTRSSGWLIALDEKTGKTLWRYSTGINDQRRGFSSSPVVTPKLVLAADYLSNAVEAIDRKTGRPVWRFEGERGFVGFPEAPMIAGTSVYAASGDRYAYSLELASGRLIWRTKMPASNEAYALCGEEMLVNYRGLAALNLKSGRIEQTLISGSSEFVTSDFVAQGNRLFIAGPQGVYALSCEGRNANNSLPERSLANGD